MTIQLVRVHEKEDVTTIIRQAIEIMEEYDGPEWIAKSVFSHAVDLLAARIPLPPPAPYDLNGLTLGPRV